MMGHSFQTRFSFTGEQAVGRLFPQVLLLTLAATKKAKGSGGGTPDLYRDRVRVPAVPAFSAV